MRTGLPRRGSPSQRRTCSRARSPRRSRVPRAAHAADEGTVNAIVLAALDRLTEGLARQPPSPLSASRSARTGRSGARHSAIVSSRRSCTTAPRVTTWTRRRPPSWATSPRMTRRVGRLGRRVRVDPPIRRSRGRLPPLPEHGPLVRRTVARRLPARSGGPGVRANLAFLRARLARPRRLAESASPGPGCRAPASTAAERLPGTTPGALRRRLEARAWEPAIVYLVAASHRREELGLLLVDTGRRRCMPSASPRAARS